MGRRHPNNHSFQLLSQPLLELNRFGTQTKAEPFHCQLAIQTCESLTVFYNRLGALQSLISPHGVYSSTAQNDLALNEIITGKNTKGWSVSIPFFFYFLSLFLLSVSLPAILVPSVPFRSWIFCDHVLRVQIRCRAGWRRWDGDSSYRSCLRGPGCALFRDMSRGRLLPYFN